MKLVNKALEIINRKKIVKKLKLINKKIMLISISMILLYIEANICQFDHQQSTKMETAIMSNKVGVFLSNMTSMLKIESNGINKENLLNKDIEPFLKMILGIDIMNPKTILECQITGSNSKKNSTAIKPEEPQKDKTASIKQNEDTQITLKEDASSITFEESDTRDEAQAIPASYGKIVLFNETNYKININELLNSQLNLKKSSKGPSILLFHTHTTESYLKGIDELNKSSGSRTNDTSRSVVGVGVALKQNLEKTFGISTLHDSTIHDTNFNYAYTYSYKTVSTILSKNPSINVVLDIHRDGIGDGNKKLRAVTKLGNKSLAQVMFVVGTNSNGKEHPYWKENLKLAIKLQDQLIKIAPGIVKPIYISKNRYNQNLSNGALIIEIGGDGNTMSETIETTSVLAKALQAVLFNKK